MSNINIKSLSYEYQINKPVFSDVSLYARSGDIVTILGANGTGKSTLLKCICGILCPTNGEISINCEAIQTSKLNERLFGYLQQTIMNIPDIGVEDYIVLGRSPYLGIFETPSINDYRIAHDLLADMDLAHLSKKLVSDLSGGELQIVRIAKILCQDPAIILLDEPTSHLDYCNQNKINKLIVHLAKAGYIIFITTHNPNHALYFDSKIGVFTNGNGFLFGEVSDVLTEPILCNAYKTNVKMIYSVELERKICITP